MSCVSPGAHASRASRPAAAPEPREQLQSAVDQVAGEMFLADLECALFPAQPDVWEGWEDHVAQDGFQPERCEAFVEDRVHGCLSADRVRAPNCDP